MHSLSKIFAHRGSSKYFPENTLLAFEAAYREKADGIELDVQMTKDGVLVVIHDETLDRTTNAKGYVKDYMYRELRFVDASYKFPQYFGMCPIPTLEEVLNWAQPKENFYVNIELKNNVIPYDNLEAKTIELIKRFCLEDRVVISSFNHYSLAHIKTITDEIETAILYSECLYKPWTYAKKLGASSIHPQYKSLLIEPIIQMAQTEHISVRAYTVNKASVMKKFFQQEIAAIITDIPKKAREIKNEILQKK